ncbi:MULTISPECIES: CIA30 family protein [unclassified Fibrobacter]|uniref:CIA30 family protein n=1 Tax=unclassified Fibrobacter TaxID=2634177 RepID=UPI001E2F52EE|nr:MULTISPECIES: CIA30 family protein [unclassified Fibrobacter]
MFSGCSDSGPETAGATSETTNGIAIVAFDGAHMPIPQARVTLYQRADFTPAESPSEDVNIQDVTQFLPSYVSALETATADDSGMVQFETEPDQCQNARCYVEGIAGEDSSLMVWSKLDAVDSMADEIELLPSVSLTVRTGAAASDSVVSRSVVMLDATPYWAKNDGSEFVFSHVPAGLYTLLADDQPVADVSLDAGASVDTLIRISNVTREYVFEDFDDGDNLNNLAKKYPNYGWYYMPHKGATFESPDSAGGFAGALVDDGAGGKYLSLKYAIQDTAYVMLGTHLGLDSGYYDLSALSAVRMKVRGDCRFAVALEHYRQLENNNYNKALWIATANDEWTELVLRPGDELLDDKNYQVAWDEISTEIGIFSVFISEGSRLDIDEIVFEGIQIID